METLRITLVQYDIAWENPSANRSRLEAWIGPLIGKTDLFLLPEMFATGFSMNARELAEKQDGPTVSWMKKMAVLSGAAIAGSLIIEEGGRFFNRFLFVTPSGEIYHYDKRHLFSIGTEDRYFNRGTSRQIVNYKGWRIALFTCYDLRFPVWCRTGNNADLMLFTANWPANRKNVWQTLLHARAIENQLYVAGVNRVGLDGAGTVHDGESMVVGPKGDDLHCFTEKGEGVETVIISLSELNTFRKKFPVWKDADLYEIKEQNPL